MATSGGLSAVELTGEAVALVALGRKAAVAYERPDLAERLDGPATRLADDRARVLVVGEFKAGKSELVNALVTARAVPADPHRATTVATLLGHAAEPSARMVRITEEGAAVETTIAPRALAEHVTEAGNDRNRAGWSHARIGLPRDLLAAGLTIVDTPGSGGLASPATVSTMAELPTADAVLVVHDAGRELTARETAVLRTATAACPTVVLVPTRIDLHPHWRRVVELDRGHLRDAGLEVPILPVSATLRLHAADTDDAALAEESGVVALATLLTERVAADRAARRAALVADEVLAVVGALVTTFRAELTGLTDPDRSRELVREIEGTRVRTARLRDRAARWQQTLNDGVGDLVSDVEHDLRDRLRSVIAAAEGTLDDTDPAKTWDQFAPWLHQQVSGAVSTNAVWAEERTRWLAERVAAHFAEDGGRPPTMRAASGTVALVDVAPGDTAGSRGPGGSGGAEPDLLPRPDHERFGPAQALLTGMRGSYGGVLMIGMVTTMAGMALINPFSVGAGLLLGSKTLVDERGRALRRRRSEAKTAVRRHIDEISFQEGKVSRDMLREVQRALRDHFTRVAGELDRTLAAAATASKAVQETSKRRDGRRADVEAELDRLAGLERRALSLRDAAGPPPGRPPHRAPPLPRPSPTPRATTTTGGDR